MDYEFILRIAVGTSKFSIATAQLILGYWFVTLRHSNILSTAVSNLESRP